MPTLHLDDLPLFYQELGRGNEVLLALHPATASSSLLQWALPKNGRYRVLLPDQRGHGKTPNPAPDFHIYRLINDMWNLLEALDILSLHGIGYSMGAGVLMGMATQQPERFKSLTLIGANHRRPTAAQLTALAGPPDQRQGVVRAIMDGERGLWAKDSLELNAFRNLYCPVHLIAGDRDPVSSLEGCIELFQVLPEAELLVVPGCGHFGFHTSALVRQYLQSIYEDNSA
jgi:pimeloyl-ACP methyl ester carboxylesterase